MSSLCKETLQSIYLQSVRSISSRTSSTTNLQYIRLRHAAQYHALGKYAGGTGRSNALLFVQISSLLLNLYNYTGYTVLDTVLLCVGIPLTLLWLGVGIGMVGLK